MAEASLGVIITGHGKQLINEFKKIGDEADAAGKRTQSGFQRAHQGLKVAGAAIAGTALAIGAASLKLGMDFEQSMTLLRTGAGETQKNIKMVSDGILNMAAKVGKTPQELASGMYMIESAGFHGAAGLSVLKAAAEGATVGNAQMATVADAVTSALNAYHLAGSHAAQVTNALVATVAAGKMHMEDLAFAIGSVLAPAAAAHLSIGAVGGAIATMTAQGTTAQNATQQLRRVILSLANPTKGAATEMQGLGLNSIDVAKNLGTRGLAGTLNLLVYAIKEKMGPAGTVLIDQMQKMAKHGKNWHGALKNLAPEQQTYIAALAKMVGGTRSMGAVLQLTGDNATTFRNNVDAVNAGLHKGGKDVTGFALAQKDLKFQMDSAKAALLALGTKLGLWLIPWVEKAITAVSHLVDWFKTHSAVAKTLAQIVGVLAVTALAAYTASMIAAAAATIAATWPVLAVIAVVAGLVIGANKLGITWGHVWLGMQMWAKNPAIHWAVVAVGNIIGWVQTAIINLGDNWSTIWRHIENAVIDAANVIGGVINQVIRVINDMIQGINDASLGLANLSKISSLGSFQHIGAPVLKPGDAGFIGPLPSPASGPGSPGFIGPLPGRAGGGAASPFHSYLVGEHGPEVMTMGASGGYVHANGGGGTTVNVYVNGIVSGHAPEVGKYLADHLIKYMRSNGKRWQNVVTPV